MQTKQWVKHAELQQRVIRKDGRVEELGTVAYYDHRRMCRILVQLERLTGFAWLHQLRRWWERNR